jgi:hypothetical protein
MNGIAVRPSPAEDVGWLRISPEDMEMEERILVSKEPPFSHASVFLEGDVIFDRSMAFDLASPIRTVSVTEVDIDRDAMAVGTRYPFWLGDIYLIAVKSDDGTIEFFSTE